MNNNETPHKTPTLVRQMRYLTGAIIIIGFVGMLEAHNEGYLDYKSNERIDAQEIKIRELTADILEMRGLENQIINLKQSIMKSAFKQPEARLPRAKRRK